MLKKILNIQGIRALSKVEQQSATGGNDCSSYSGSYCYGPYAGCGSCGDYQALPSQFKGCVLVHTDCVEEGTPM